jgi:hypothetical protein
VPADLVAQLLEAGASVNDPSGLCNLQPLHLACMPRVRSVKQVRQKLSVLSRRPTDKFELQPKPLPKKCLTEAWAGQSPVLSPVLDSTTFSDTSAVARACLHPE